MTDQKDNIDLGGIVFGDNTQWEIRGFVWDNPVPDLLLSFCPSFSTSCWLPSNAFGDFFFVKFYDRSTILVKILCNASAYILPIPRLWTS